MPTSKPLWTQKSCSVTTPFSFFLLKISFTMVSPCFASVFANKLQPHTLLLDENISQKLQQAKSPHPTLFLSVLLPLTSIQWSLFDFEQRCWIASPTWSLKLATDQSSWQCKIQSWTLDRKSEIPHNDVQCFNYPIMDVIHQTVPNKKS